MADEALTTGAPDAAAEPTLRDTISANLAEVTKTAEDTGSAAADTTTVASAAVPEKSGPSTEAVPAADSGRARNPDGTFAPKTEAPAAVAAPAVVEAPATVAERMPTSFKREMQAEWDKASPALRQEIVRRESDFSKGIQQYKAVADRAKPLDDAVAPYREILKQHGMEEGASVRRLLDTHHALALGPVENRVGIINGIIGDYKLPVRLAQQNANGEWQLVDAPQPRPAPAPQQQQQDPRAIVREELANQEVQRQLSDFMSAKDASGNVLYPHYEKVKDDMALILESGRAEDLKGAYDKAIRLHDDIWQAQQQATVAADAKKVAEAKRQAVARARSSAVSVVSSTPSGNMVATGDKSLRDQLTENLREVAGGRV